MFLLKALLLGILFKVSMAGIYVGKRHDTFGNLTLQKSSQSTVKKLHQYLKDGFNMNGLIKKLALNRSNSTDECFRQILSMNNAQLTSGK